MAAWYGAREKEGATKHSATLATTASEHATCLRPWGVADSEDTTYQARLVAVTSFAGNDACAPYPCGNKTG